MIESQKTLILRAFSQQCEFETDWMLTKWQRRWLTVKFILCVLLRRQQSIHWWAAFAPDHVCVVLADAHKYPCEWGECADWTEYHVGKGLVHNWFCLEMSNGYP